MPRFRHRSSSLGSHSESNNGSPSVPATLAAELNGLHRPNPHQQELQTADWETAQKLLVAILYMKDGSGRSFLHTKFHLSWAKALLDRAKSLDERESRSTSSLPSSSIAGVLQRRFLLQPDRESGYTPLHRAIMESNLAAILLFLRHVTHVDGSERFTQRPMSVLHSGDDLPPQQQQLQQQQQQHGHNDAPLATAVVSAVDHEGLTPLKLLGVLQRGELALCRKAMQSYLPHVDIRAVQRLRPRSTSAGGQGDELEVDFFSENGDVLRRLHRRRNRGENDDDSNDDSSSESSIDDAKDGATYACEVVTFGQGCALGVVSSASSSTSSTPTTSLSNSSSWSKDNRYFNASTFVPQRVNEFAQETVGRDGSAIMAAAATHHTLVALKNGHLYACGLEKGGRLGLGDDQPQQCPLPRRILGPLQRRQVVYVAAAENHSLCVTKDASVFSWGSNRFGQLGDNFSTGASSSSDNTSNSRTLPRRVDDLKGHPCVAVAAGERHSVALTRKGEVYVWGDNSSGQLGVPRRSGIQKVQRVEALWNNQNSPKVAISVAASEQSTLVLTAPGMTHLNSIYEWGHGNHVPMRVHFESAFTNGGGSNGNSKTGRKKDRQVTAMGGARRSASNPVAIACAKFHNAAIDSDGMVYTWGLHAESLGRSATTKTGKQQRRNSSPQLVTGMLPEKGGGFAIKIAASGQHTAVVTDTGALFTWGTTDSKSVLGHEGLRWQPNPRRVPGVHRAVNVAVAKEHTVLLIGASFPKIPRISGAASLEAISSYKVAEHVDLFNVIPILVMAERTECAFLIKYCNDFVRRNLDAVLCVGRKRDMNQYLNDILADTTYRAGRRFRDNHHHPLVFDVLSAGNEGRPSFANKWWSHDDGWTKGCKDLAGSPGVQRLLAFAEMREYEEDVASGLKAKGRRRASSCSSDCDDSRYRSRSLSSGSANELSSETKKRTRSGSEGSVATNPLNADSSTEPLAKQKHSSLSREIRSVRKKIKQIAHLEETQALRLVVLTTEEKAKVDRRPALEAELKVYETALEEVERRIKELSDGNKAEKSSFARLVEKTSTDDNGVSVQKVTFADEGATADCTAPKDEKPAEKESEGAQDQTEKEQFYCALCSIRCSDKSNLLLHQNGRKHRNRALQAAEEEKKKTATSILEQQHAEQLKQPHTCPHNPDTSVRKNAWGVVPSQPTPFKLPPPPHPVVLPVTPNSSNATSETTPPLVRSRPSPLKASQLPATSFSLILREESLKEAKEVTTVRKSYQPKRTVWETSSGSTRCVPISLYSSTTTGLPLQPDLSSTPRSSVSLADFLSPKRANSATSVSSSKKAPQTAAWLRPQATVQNPSSSSLMQIQAEEAGLREKQDKSTKAGEGGGSWFVERRERVDSFQAIQIGAQKEQEQQQLIEEQKAIEAQIQQDLRRQQEAIKKGRAGIGGGSESGDGGFKKQKRKPQGSKGRQNGAKKKNGTNKKLTPNKASSLQKK